MKKILILIPLLLITIGCVDSELVVPGENIGEGNVDENPTETETILQSFNYSSQGINYQYNFDADGILQTGQIAYAGASTTGIFSFSNGILTTISSDNGVYSNTTTITYDDNGRPIELNAETTPENKLVLTYNGNDITGVRTIGGVEENIVQFTTDSYGYINGYSFTDVTSGDDFELNLILTGNQLTTSQFNVNGVTRQLIDFSYDNKINPVHSQTIDVFNQAILNDVFEFQAEFPVLPMVSYAFYRSPNNITQYIGEGAGGAFVEGTVNTTYEYTEDGFPTSAVIAIDDVESGSIVYTYY